MGNKENQNLLTSYNLGNIARRLLFGILSMGPIPDHIAFIMDGNRRYSKKNKLEEGTGHNLGFTALTSMLKYCYELEVKYITVYAFSIDNFKRRPEEVKSLMELIREKIESLIKEDSIVNQHGVRVYFVGDLKLLDDSVRLAAEKAMEVTAGNSKAVLSICIAYTSTNEIVNAVEQSCVEKWDELDSSTKNSISVMDVEKHMYMRVAPNPDIVVRTSGENRLSNFLLWQSANSILYNPAALWPEIGLRHLVWAVLNFQRNQACLETKKKQQH
ncbi:hypothetical protein SOVF_138730 [Spinacia oleracea]|nr:dehydrodolichyl diphosphate synthase CPT3-like isoform X2 [Spinacia oleracea]KNA11043.1 hypothetical protein SOVF_138730 [Spinacia oleracea]